MKIKIYHIVFFLMVFIPFESIILKFLPVSDYLYSLARMAVEFVIYALLIYVISSKFISRTPFKRNPLHIPLMIFIFYSFSLILINSAPLSASIINMRAILRYIALFYVMININLEYRIVVKLTKAILGIAILQSFIAVYHHYFGISDFWMPRANVLEIAGKVSNFRILGGNANRSGREIGVAIGTFSDSVALSMFLVIASAILIPFLFKKFNPDIKRRLWAKAFMILLLIGLLFTYSRGSFLIVLLMFPIAWLLLNNIKKTSFIITLILILFIPGILILNDINFSSNEQYINPVFDYVSPVENVTSIFSESYQNRTLQSSRGFVIITVGGKLLQSMPFFGYGPAMDFALESAMEKNFKFVEIKNLHFINDVYWIAFIMYYGLIGLSIFLFILYQLSKVSLYVFQYSEFLFHRSLALSFLLILVTAIPYTFIIRTFVFRQYSFYFWSIAALSVIEWHRLIKVQNENRAKAQIKPQ